MRAVLVYNSGAARQAYSEALFPGRRRQVHKQGRNAKNVLITTQEDLDAFIRSAQESPVLAIDTEFIPEQTYHPVLCLVQLGTCSQQVAVDPLALPALDGLDRLLSDPAITKVFHAGAQDVEILLQQLHVLPRPLFDIQIAEAYLGGRIKSGYAELVHKYCGVTLAKSQTMSDWHHRPLSAAQLSYALDDVRYLPQIWQQMQQELETAGRLDWVREDFERLGSPQTYAARPEEAYLRLKNTNGLSRQQMSIAREVCSWRESVAERRNLPRRLVMADETVTEICRKLPDSAERLRAMRGLSRAAAADISGLLLAIERGRSCAAEELPAVQRSKRPPSAHKAVSDLACVLVRKIAADHSIAPELLGSRSDIQDYLAHPESSRLSHGWRAEVLGGTLDDLLHGRVGLTVANGDVEVL